MKIFEKNKTTPNYIKKLSSLSENQNSLILNIKKYIIKYNIILFLIGTVIIILLWWYLFFQNIGLDSSQWILSALIQSLSAILGLLIVIYVFINSKKSELNEKLCKFEPKYNSILISPTENGTPFILQLRKEFFEKIIQKNYETEIKFNPLTLSETDYLEKFYSISVLAEYLIITNHLNYSIKEVRDEIESVGYFKKRGKKLFKFAWIGRELLNPEIFFYHLFSLPFILEGEFGSKLAAIRHEYSKDNIPKIRFKIEEMKILIGNDFIILGSFIVFNIIGELFTLSITTINSFNYITTRILIGIFISSGLIVFWLLFYYLFRLMNKSVY